MLNTKYWEIILNQVEKRNLETRGFAIVEVHDFSDYSIFKSLVSQSKNAISFLLLLQGFLFFIFYPNLNYYLKWNYNKSNYTALSISLVSKYFI